MNRRKPFADIVAEAKAQPAADLSSDSGYASFRDPDGNELAKVGELSPSEARELVREGALLAFEDCGCGGAYGGCDVKWIDVQTSERLAAVSLPRLAKGKRSASWIDLWRGTDVSVVYAHGSVKWGHELA